MKINFPNASRSYDEIKNHVCFWGYDRTIEVSFFMEAGAIKRLSKDTGSSESELLKAFDGAIEKIHKVANNVYVSGGKGKGSYAYILTAEDF